MTEQVKAPKSLLDCKEHKIGQGAVRCMELLAIASTMEKAMYKAGNPPEVNLTDTVLAETNSGGKHLSIIIERLDMLKAPEITDRIDPYVRIFCASSSNNPATAVMWAYTLVDMAARTGDEIGLAAFLNAFPDGLPTTVELKNTWEAQKHPDAPLNNLLDLRKNWVGWVKERAKEADLG